MFRALCVAVLFLGELLTVPPPVEGQRPTRCAYDDCALRIEGGLVMEGLEGEPVGSLRNMQILERIDFPERTRPQLEDFEEAVRSAARWDRAESVFQWIGAAAGLFLLGSIPFGKTEQALDIAVPVSIVTSSGALIMDQVSSKRIDRAELALGRAIWWYNRDLTR